MDVLVCQCCCQTPPPKGNYRKLPNPPASTEWPSCPLPSLRNCTTLSRLVPTHCTPRTMKSRPPMGTSRPCPQLFTNNQLSEKKKKKSEVRDSGPKTLAATDAANKHRAMGINTVFITIFFHSRCLYLPQTLRLWSPLCGVWCLCFCVFVFSEGGKQRNNKTPQPRSQRRVVRQACFSIHGSKKKNRDKLAFVAF